MHSIQGDKSRFTFWKEASRKDLQRKDSRGFRSDTN